MDWHEAVEVAARAHGLQRDRSGSFELAHGIEVAAALGEDATDDMRAAAVLHDALEDTDWGPEDLVAAGVPALVVEAVEHLTRRGQPTKETYRDFVERTAAANGPAGRIARAVKLADLAVNERRADRLPEGESLRRKRFLPAIERITEAMRERGELDADV